MQCFILSQREAYLSLTDETFHKSSSKTEWVLLLALMHNYSILLEEMTEDRRTGAPVLSATGSYLEYKPGAESRNFFASDASKDCFLAEESSINTQS